MDLIKSTVLELRDGVHSKKISASEVADFFLKRIERLDPAINAFITINENARAEAESIDQLIAQGRDPGPLAGVPIAVKDLFCTQGLRTTAASKMLESFVPPYSATVVQKLKAAGAVIIGKTSLDEFAMGSSNETSAFGVVKNPWNLDYVPGGSSGGSAAALAARMAPAALGTDTGGSIRQPASFCGVYGIKPTYGRVSRYGIIAYASSLDQAGPMAHSTTDCALLLEAMSGADGFDSTASQVPVPEWTRNLRKDLRGVRIGLPKEYFSDKVDPEIRKVMEDAIEACRKDGAEILEISLPLVQHSVAVYYLIATSEASSNLARYDGIRYGYRSDFVKDPTQKLDEFYSRNRGEAFGREVKRRIMLGTHALSSGYYDAYYQKASKVRRMIRDEFLRAFENCDVLLSPVATSPGFKIGSRITDPLEMYYNDIFTTSTNLAGLPGMSVPGGYSKDGLPIGVQLTAGHFNEQIIFDVSLALERSLKQKIEERSPRVI